MKKTTTQKHATVRLNAIDKDSSGAFSESVQVTSVTEFLKYEKEFEQRVPFMRFYYDHEYLDGDRDLSEKCIEASENEE